MKRVKQFRKWFKLYLCMAALLANVFALPVYTFALPADSTEAISIEESQQAAVQPLAVSKVAPVTTTKKTKVMPAGGKLKLDCATVGASVYYTADGNVPDISSNFYTGPIVINNDVTIKAVAVKAGMENSDIFTMSLITEVGYFEDFENFNLQSPPTGWQVTDASLGSDHTRYFTSNSATGAYVDLQNPDSYSGNVAVECDFMSPASSTDLFWLMSTKTAAVLRIQRGSGNKLQFNNDTTTGAQSFVLNLGQWYHGLFVINTNSLKDGMAYVDSNQGVPANLSAIAAVSWLRFDKCAIDNIMIYPYVPDQTVTNSIKDRLTFDSITNQPVSAIRTDFELPTVRKYLYNEEYTADIQWTSSDENAIRIVDENGKKIARIMRSPAGDVNVTLQAQITSGVSTVTQSFNLMVLHRLSPAESVAYDLDNIGIPDGRIIDGSLQIPETGNEGSQFNWVSSEPDIVKIVKENDALFMKVNSDGYYYNDIKIKVTAACGDSTGEKELTLQVRPKKGMEDGKKTDVSSAKEGYSNFRGNDGDFATAWVVTDNDRKPWYRIDFGEAKTFKDIVIAPYEAQNIKEYAIEISQNGIDWQKIYTRTGLTAPIQVINLDKAYTGRYVRLAVEDRGLEEFGLYEFIIYEAVADGSTVDLNTELASISVPAEVTGNFTLPVQTASGLSIAWTSSDSQVIAVNGNQAKVTRKSVDTDVTLTAVVSNNSSSLQRTFAVTVKAENNTITKGTSGGHSGGGLGGGSYTPVPPETTGVGPDTGISAQNDIKIAIKDINNLPWASSYIETLYRAGIISGDNDGNFQPERNITREEFVKMVVMTLNAYDPTIHAEFSDISDNDWYSSYVAAAVQKNVIQGIGDGVFGAGRNITRQDMAAIAVRVAQQANVTLPVNGSVNDFEDHTSIADYARDGVMKLQQAGIISGTGDGFFNPNGYATRAEAAKIIEMLRELITEGHK